MKVARDDRFVYFYCRTSAPVTEWTGRNWMLLYIGTEEEPPLNWCGFQFAVNKAAKDGGISVLERSRGGWDWEPAADIWYRAEGSELHLAIPRDMLGLVGRPVKLRFKWADHLICSMAEIPWISM